MCVSFFFPFVEDVNINDPQAEFVRTACPRSEIVQLLGQCRAIDEQQIRRQSNDL
jgi:hypothetical protein